MSRTDKDVPWEVQVAQRGLIRHDHTQGICVPETEAHFRLPRQVRWYGHERTACAKWERVVTTCERPSPKPAVKQVDAEYTYRKRLLQGTCWARWVVRTWGKHPTYGFQMIVSREYHANECLGHPEWVLHEEVPCECDDWQEPTCEIDTYEPERHWHRHRAGRRRRLNGTRPLVRSLLHEAMLLRNSGHVLDDEDEPEPWWTTPDCEE